MSNEFMKYVNEHKDEWIAEGEAKGKAEGSNDMLNIAQALREGKSDSEIIEFYNVTMEQIAQMKQALGM